MLSSPQPLSVLIILTIPLSSWINLKSALHNPIWNYNINHSLISRVSIPSIAVDVIATGYTWQDYWYLCANTMYWKKADVVLISLAGPTSCLCMCNAHVYRVTLDVCVQMIIIKSTRLYLCALSLKASTFTPVFSATLMSQQQAAIFSDDKRDLILFTMTHTCLKAYFS